MTSKLNDWANFVNERDDFQLPNYIYTMINELMKDSLDLGTLLSNDKQKLRAFKEQTKTSHKDAWTNVAELFVTLGLIKRCTCSLNGFCEICKGSRYVPESSINSEVTVENMTFIAETASSQTIQSKLASNNR